MKSLAVSNVDNSRFKNTKTGVKDGVIASTISGAGFYTLSKAHMSLLSKAPYQVKRNFISSMYDHFQETLGKNMKKSTVSKEMKKTQKFIKSFPVVALVTATSALVGGLAGACVDAFGLVFGKEKKA